MGIFSGRKKGPTGLLTRDRFGAYLETPYLSIQLLNFIVTAMRIVSGREGRRWCAGCRYAPMACDTWFKTHGRSGWRRSLRKATGLLETLFEGAAQVPVFTEHHTPTGMQPPPPQRSCCHCTHPCQSPCSTSLACHLSCETASCSVQLKDPGALHQGPD